MIITMSLRFFFFSYYIFSIPSQLLMIIDQDTLQPKATGVKKVGRTQEKKSPPFLFISSEEEKGKWGIER